MRVDTEGNRAALAAEAQTNAAAKESIRDYLARTGLSVTEFARRINYSGVALEHFFADRYHNVGRTAVHLVRAATEFMQAHPIGEQAPLLGDLYETEHVRTIRRTFAQLLPRPTSYVIYGPPGSQKSFVLEREVQRLNREQIAQETGARSFYVYCRKNIRPRDLLRRVCIALGCRTGSEIEPMIQGIRFDYRNNRVVLIFDEAQRLSIECLETIQELLDQPPHFSMLFAGTHDLKKKFDEFSATLEQWNSRIVAKVSLPGLTREEARAIVLREIGDLLEGKSARQAEVLIDKLIVGATAHDEFEGGRSYINVRTLTNVLNQVRAEAEANAAAAPQKVEAIA